MTDEEKAENVENPPPSHTPQTPDSNVGVPQTPGSNGMSWNDMKDKIKSRKKKPKSFVVSIILAVLLALSIPCCSLMEDVGYDEGYDVGYDEGYDEGYNVGYDVGYGEGLANDVTKDKLNKAIKKAEEYSSDEYTEETFAALEESYDAATIVADDKCATQDEVDDATDALNKAIKAMKTQKEAEEEAKKQKEQEQKELDKMYSEVEYSKLARNPNDYAGKMLKITGRVLQTNSSFLRVATEKSQYGEGGYGADDVIYVTYDEDDIDTKILEDDIVTIQGLGAGTWTYTTVLGAECEVPWIDADKIKLK